MTAFARYFRVRVRAEDNLSDVLVLTSFPGGTNPYLTSPPQGAGLELDVLNGQITYGSYVVRAADAPSTGQAVTDVMADSGGHYNLLGRVTVVDTSPDGAVWTPHISGYLQSIRYPTPAEVELNIGDSLRVDRRRDIFKTITDNFRAATSLIGGPVVGGFFHPGAFDYGPWRMKVGSASGTTVRLDFMSGPVPASNSIPYGPAYESRSGTVDATAIQIIESWADPYRMAREGGRYWFPGLEAELTKVSDGSIVRT